MVTMIDGKPFVMGRYLADPHEEAANELTKTQANSTAKAYRKKGWLARVKKDVNGYYVLKSQNKASFYR